MNDISISPYGVKMINETWPSILLWGGRSKARIIEEMIKESHVGKVKVIFDNTLENAEFETDAKFVNDINELKTQIKNVSHFVVCIGSEHGFARFKTAEYLEKMQLKPLTLVHGKSFIEPTSKVGYGCQVMPGVVIHKFATIGNYSIINTNASIDHECFIGNGVHIMGAAALAGKVRVGDYSTIGTNATILPNIQIGEGSFVGAGSVVTKNVEPYTVVAGVPAKKIRINKLNFYEDLLIKLSQ